jgi:hypothetical protein
LSAGLVRFPFPNGALHLRLCFSFRTTVLRVPHDASGTNSKIANREGKPYDFTRMRRGHQRERADLPTLVVTKQGVADRRVFSQFFEREADRWNRR